MSFSSNEFNQFFVSEDEALLLGNGAENVFGEKLSLLSNNQTQDMLLRVHKIGTQYQFV